MPTSNPIELNTVCRSTGHGKRQALRSSSAGLCNTWLAGTSCRCLIVRLSLALGHAQGMAGLVRRNLNIIRCEFVFLIIASVMFWSLHNASLRCVSDCSPATNNDAICAMDASLLFSAARKNRSPCHAAVSSRALPASAELRSLLTVAIKMFAAGWPHRGGRNAHKASLKPDLAKLQP